MIQDPFDRSVRRHSSADARHLFSVHLAVYVAVNVFLALIWAITSDGFSVIPWFLFPLGGWGIGIVAHYAMIRPRPTP